MPVKCYVAQRPTDIYTSDSDFVLITTDGLPVCWTKDKDRDEMEEEFIIISATAIGRNLVEISLQE